MSLKHAVLISLAECEATGYDLTKRFDESLGFFWNASHQQIYQELAKMAAAGWVTYQAVEQTAKPSKKIYRITVEGENELKRWLHEPVAPCPLKDAFLMKVFAGHLIPADSLLVEMEQRYQGYQHLLARYRAIEAQHFQNWTALPVSAQYIYMTLRSGILHTEAALKWADETRRFLQGRVADSNTAAR